VESTFFIFIAGIAILMLFGAVSSSRRRPGSHSDMSDFSLFDPDVTQHHIHHHSHHHEHFDHNSSSDFSHSHSHVDSGSCHSGDFGGGCDG
jgi:hypothetical protein